MKNTLEQTHWWETHVRSSTVRPTLTQVLDATWVKRAVMILVIVALALTGLTQLQPPASLPVTAPATAFSADRAMEHLSVVAAESRAIGMPGHDATRDYLITQLTAMGLQPEIQTTTAVLRFEGAEDFSAGEVTNIIARIPGTDSDGAIALNAHYDSGATGPAASDNGSGVVVVLETVRAIQAGTPLRNDLIIVFTDAEENGDLGAAAFNQEHPWADDVRLAINYEAQGSGGPAILYATSENDGWLTDQYFEIAPRASAYSLLPEFVRLLPGMRLACDLEDYLLNGSAGLGFVYADDTAAYHTARDSMATIDSGSIQQEGENTVAIVQHFGNRDLADLPLESNRVFFTILPGVVVHYDGAWIVPLAALTTVLLVGLLIVGLRRHLVSFGGMAVGLLAFVLGTVVTVVAIGALWYGIRTVNADYRVLLIGGYQNGLYIVALSLAAVALMGGMYAFLRRHIHTEDLVAGALIGWLFMLWAVSLTAPGVSYIVIWPLLFAALPLAWSIFAAERDGRGWVSVAVLVLALVPTIFILPGTFYQVVALLNRLDFFSTLTGGIPFLGAWVLFIAPLVGLYLPQIQMLGGSARQPRLGVVPAMAAVAAIALIGWGMTTSGFDAEHPRPDHIAYDLDADTGQARWVSIDQELDAWTSQFFPEDATRGEYEIDAGTTVPAYLVPTTTIPIEASTITVEDDVIVDGVRTVTVRMTSPRAVAELQLLVQGQGELLAASVDGRELDLGDYAPAIEGELNLSYVSSSPIDVEITLEVRSPEPVEIALRETSYGLPEVPGMTVEPRPPGYMPATGFPLDATIVRQTFTI